MTHILAEATERKFSKIKPGQKFATVANGVIAVWTKIYDGEPVFKAGDTDDGYTCRMPNAITDTGFPAVFNVSCMVCPVDIK